MLRSSRQCQCLSLKGSMESERHELFLDLPMVCIDWTSTFSDDCKKGNVPEGSYEGLN